MRSIATITVPANETRLTTLDRVKLDHSITGSENDDLLLQKIDEATSDIESHIGRVLSRATISQRFWGACESSEYLILARNPVASVTSVTVDDVAVDSDEYRIDPDTGLLYRLDASGYPSFWDWCKDVVVVFVGGYLLPGEDGRTLPHALESAAVDLVGSYWQNRGRDPRVKSEDIPGLGAFEYWVGSVGEAGQLPPDVVTKISPFRRVLV